MDSINFSATLLVKQLYSAREKTGDVTFVVDSERIPAHRSVLAVLSAKYEAQFYGSRPDQGDIHVEDVSAAGFNEFIKLFYLGEADFTMETIEDILNMSSQCLVYTFVAKCRNFLQSQISKQNVCRIYHLAILYDIDSARVLCERIIGKNLAELFSGNNFLEINHDTLLHILVIEPLNCREIDVLKGCVEWARASCVRKKLNDTEMGKLREELGDAVAKVRFKSMSLHEFVNFNGMYEGFFTAEEFIEITNIIGGLLRFTSLKFNNTPRLYINSFTINGTEIPPTDTDIGQTNDHSANRKGPASAFVKTQGFNFDAPGAINQASPFKKRLFGQTQALASLCVPRGPINNMQYTYKPRPPPPTSKIRP